MTPETINAQVDVYVVITWPGGVGNREGIGRVGGNSGRHASSTKE